MELKLTGSRMTPKSFLSLFLSFCMVFALVLSVWAQPAQAKTVRIAVISSLDGDVTVKKGGGSKVYDAYEDMSLNQGDTLYTGADSGATLNLSEGDGEITIGDNAEVNVSDLSSSGGKKSKLKIWAGSMWMKVKSLASSDDEFEVETPTAVMGVRGTEFFVHVDPVNRKTTTVVAAGKIAATTVVNGDNLQQQKKLTYLYPTQQITLDSRDEVDDLALKVDFVDVNTIVEQASPNVIEAMIKNKAEIDKENDEFIAKSKKLIEDGKAGQTDGTFVIKNLDDLSKVTNNFDNLIGNIAKQAVSKNKIDKSAMDSVIQQANQKIDKQERKLDLGNVKSLDKSAGTDPDRDKARQAARDKALANKLKKQEAETKKLDELKKKFEQIIKNAQDALKKNDEASKKAAQTSEEKAEAVLKAGMTAEQKKQFDEAKQKTDTTTNSNSSNNGGGSGGSSGGTGGTDTTPPTIQVNDVYVAQSYVTGTTEAGAVVVVKRNNTTISTTTAYTNGIFYAYLNSGVTLSAGDTLSITATDAANNTSAPVTKVVQTAPATTAKVTLVRTPDTSNPSFFDLNVNMSDFTGASSLYAVELHLLYKSSSATGNGIHLYDNTPIARHTSGTAIFNPDISAESIQQYDQLDTGTNTYTKELIYAVTNFGTSSTDISFSGTKTLVTIPFHAINYGTSNIPAGDALSTISVGYIKVIRKDGAESVTALNVPSLKFDIGYGLNYQFTN